MLGRGGAPEQCVTSATPTTFFLHCHMHCLHPSIQVANRQFSTQTASNHFHTVRVEQKPPARHTLTGFRSVPSTSNLTVHSRQHSTGQQHLACPSCCGTCSAHDQISHPKAAQQLIEAPRPSKAPWSGLWGW